MASDAPRVRVYRVSRGEPSRSQAPRYAVDHKDGRLRLIDVRHAEESAARTRVGDRKGAAGHVVGRQLILARLAGQVGNRPRQAVHVETVGIPDDRDDEHTTFNVGSIKGGSAIDIVLQSCEVMGSYEVIGEFRPAPEEDVAALTRR